MKIKITEIKTKQCNYHITSRVINRHICSYKFNKLNGLFIDYKEYRNMVKSPIITSVYI